MKDIVGKMMYSVRFQDGLKKEIFLNQLTILVVRSEVEEEIKVRVVKIIPEVREELGCYHWVYIHLNFINEGGLYKREDQVGVMPDSDEE